MQQNHHVKRKWTESFSTCDQVNNDDDLKKVQSTRSSTYEEDIDKKDMEEDDEELKIKRKAQNRAAQRAFRERKERYVKDLEIKIKQVQDNHIFATNQLFQENHHLRSIICRLEAENIALKGVTPLANSINNHDLNLFSSSSPQFNTLGLLPQQNLLLPPVMTGYQPIQPNPITNKENKKSINQPKPLAAKPPVCQQQIQPIHKSIKTKKKEQNRKQKNQNQQTLQPEQQEFTFSITTPATLRADTLEKNPSVDTIELVPLYHPDHHHPALSQVNDNPTTDSSLSCDSPTLTSATSVIGMDTTMPSLSFLDGYDAFEKLYVDQDASLFDDDHGLGLSMIQSRRNSEQDQTMKDEKMIKEQKPGSASDRLLMESQHSNQSQSEQQQQQQQQQQGRRAGPGATTTIVMEDDEKTPIWQKITEHAQNNKFSVDHLVEAVRSTTTSKRKNKLLVDEWELEAMVHDLNYYL
ncbi:uncharacterized protein BX664DRAFT_388193 [Halteromyces radiatus]|uniref:uncharacterized protein n=1 Tax=Halteromyces radiatus TaxID=101107 RepID=UPI00221EB8C6|nr:uncharacterized protein BX664DRAFT_388193 [Halteromyces radiatus]KAI8083097.1 hypothetical protein BX664DRAFT_388193 [Halteromyces radiatus]